MIGAVLEELVTALGAEGAAVIDLSGKPTVLHAAGGDAGAILSTAANLLSAGGELPVQGTGEDGRQVLVCTCKTQFGHASGMALWRISGSRTWDGDEQLLIGSATAILRMALEHGAIQHDMSLRARTDPLTGLLNRRAFLEDLPRHIDRLNHEGTPGALMYADLDNFKPVNDRLGHDVGDRVLCETARMLRNLVRPTDLVARLGGDEFAVWMNGSDERTAVERAEALRVNVPRELARIAGCGATPPSLSIGIAIRRSSSAEDIESLMRRADQAMYQVKRTGRAHWLVADEARGMTAAASSANAEETRPRRRARRHAARR